MKGFPYLVLLALHVACVVPLILLRARGRRLEEPGRGAAFLILRAPELLFAATTVLFLFTYIYATNANMDYVQRFMQAHETLRLAPNSTLERRDACLRFLPLLALDAAWYLWGRLRRRDGGWGLPCALLSGILMALSFPSFLSTEGMPVLAWFCLVPLLACLEGVSPSRRTALGWGIFYGVFAGVLQTMITNYWLGTFNLLTLQFVTVVTALEYVPFMAAALLIRRRAGALGFLVFPMAWTVFDWLRSMGFLGYPWGMLGTSQYAVIPLIQISSLTGVWGVTFIVTLCNAVVAHYANAAIAARVHGGSAPSRLRSAPAIVAVAVLAVALGWGVLRTAQEPPRGAVSTPAPRTVRLALIQQNTDPRKDDYRAAFDTLRELTDGTLAEKPDLMVWSETAFVPNIRRWSREDPETMPLAALVRDFLAYQKTLGTWLITGNDDYSLVTRDGVEERLEYNGAVLFSPRGERRETYHKMHLVPFTEYFPYKKELPRLYAMLRSFDAYLWEPGDRRVVFTHPKVAFCTPICFEDVFPDDVRRSVAAGSECILNLSNDFWSLTETEAMQHASNAVFRAVENDRPLARASASGLTCLVDSRGRIRARSPFFTESSLVVDVPLRPVGDTPYTRWGDWFPRVLAVMLCVLFLGGVAWQRSRRAGIRGRPA
jgi:apolipoprotein N-acyltransferase